MNNIVAVNGRAIERIEYQGKPVVTLPMVDDLHERPTKTAGKAFRRHKKRMISSEDYFEIPFDEWKPLLKGHDMPLQNGGRRGDMIFLTETGYLMLVKVFDDDLSWTVQRALARNYFTALSDTSPDKLIEIRHRRGVDETKGLDVRYTLDLTKICTNPTREGLMIVERITGIDLSDVIQTPAADKAFISWLATCGHDANRQTAAADLYESFCTWFRSNHESEPPSQRWFGKHLAAFGYQRVKSGNVYYEGIGLASLTPELQSIGKQGVRYGRLCDVNLVSAHCEFIIP
jgi:hypothetical protein